MNEINYTQGMWADLTHNNYNYFSIDYDTITREVMAIIDRYKEKESDNLSPRKEVMKHTMD